MHSIIRSITFITLWLEYKDGSWSINCIIQHCHRRKWRRSCAEVGKNKSYSTACGLKLYTLYTFVMLHLLTRNQSKGWMDVICKNHLAHHRSVRVNFPSHATASHPVVVGSLKNCILQAVISSWWPPLTRWLNHQFPLGPARFPCEEALNCQI